MLSLLERQELSSPHPPHKGLFIIPYLSSFPCVKKDRSLQPCLDYHRLDHITVEYGLPFPFDLNSSSVQSLFIFQEPPVKLNKCKLYISNISLNGHFISENRMEMVKVQVVADGQLASPNIQR